jgi:hypothetical protein
MIPAIIIEPDPAEEAEGEQAVGDGTKGEIHVRKR